MSNDSFRIKYPDDLVRITKKDLERLRADRGSIWLHNVQLGTPGHLRLLALLSGRVVRGVELEGIPPVETDFGRFGPIVMVELRYHWWNWLLLGFPGHFARKRLRSDLAKEGVLGIHYEVL